MGESRSIDDVVDDLVSIPEAARALQIDERTARRWANAGTFPGGAARKDGRRWVVSVRLLDRYFHGEPS